LGVELKISLIDTLILLGLGKILTKFFFKSYSREVLLSILAYCTVIKSYVLFEYDAHKLIAKPEFRFLNKEETKRARWLYSNMGAFFPIIHPYHLSLINERKQEYDKKRRLEAIESNKRMVDSLVESCIKDKDECVSSSISLSNGYLMSYYKDEEKEYLASYKKGIIRLVESNKMKTLEMNCKSIGAITTNLHRYYNWKKISGPYYQYLKSYLNINLEKEYYTKCIKINNIPAWQHYLKLFKDDPIALKIIEEEKRRMDIRHKRMN